MNEIVQTVLAVRCDICFDEVIQRVIQWSQLQNYKVTLEGEATIWMYAVYQRSYMRPIHIALDLFAWL